jgi:hypothetical protein
MRFLILGNAFDRWESPKGKQIKLNPHLSQYKSEMVIGLDPIGPSANPYLTTIYFLLLLYYIAHVELA